MSMICMTESTGPYTRHDKARASPQAHVGAVQWQRPASTVVERVRADGETARGKPPPVSARFVVGLQWAMFAACALRILVLAP